MGFLANEWITIPLFSIGVAIVVFLNFEKVYDFLYRSSLGRREEIIKLMDLMFVEVNVTKLTWAMILISYGLGALVFLALWPDFIMGLFLGSVVTAVGWTLPPNIVKSLWEKRCNKLVDQMVDALTIMGNGIRSGLGITQCMERVVEHMKGPIAQEFGLVLSKVRLGMPLEDALNELGERIPRPDVQMFVTAINILKETGGNLGETFTTIVLTVRERQKIEKKIEAMTTQGVWQGIIITMVPFFLLIMFSVIDPNFIKPLFTTTVGIIFLMIMLAFQIIGGLMIKKIVTIKV